MVKNCCVIGCKSIWTPNSKVSFHKFPKNDELCTKWLDVLTVTNMSEHKRVCGRHFKSEDFMEFASTRRLKPDVVPSYDQDVPDDDCDVKSTISEEDSAADSDCTFVPSSPEPDDFDRIKMSPPTLIQASVASQPAEGALTPMLPVTTKYIMCRICLATDRELFHMSERNILELYQELIGAQVGASRPQHVCWECARRLRALALFRRRALQANALLQTLPTEDSYMLISNKLKEHFSSKLKVTETKTQPDFEYKFSKTKHKYCLDPDDTDYTEKESIDESVYLEIDDPEIKIDTDNYERFALEYTKMESEDDPTLENSMKVESDMSDDDDNMFESIEDTERTTPNHGLSSPENNTKFISKMPEPLPIFNASDVPPRKVVRNIAENATEIVLNKDIIDVTELSHEEQIENLVRKKDSAAFKEAKFKCMKCYRGYMDQDMYKWHASRHDVKNGAHVCSVCKVRFSRASQLAQHAAAEHAARYSCKQCPFITYKRRHAKHHEDFHTGGSFQCPYCPQAYANAPLYFKHVRLMHPPDCACELCGYMFLGAKEVEFHKQLKHKHDQVPLDGPHCEVCDVTFASDEAHERHLRLSPRHASDRDQKKIPNPVVLVMKKWSLMPQPRGPRKRQSKDKPRECEQCGLMVPNMKSYSQHYRRAHPQAQRPGPPPARPRGCMCEQCGKIFSSPCLLRHHMWVHRGGGKPYACERCGQTFTQKSSLASHQRAHQGPRPTHPCPECGKHFLYRHNMLKHMFIHTGLKPYECESCGKCFRTLHQRQAHFDHVHLHKPWPARPDRYRAKRAGTNRT